MLYALDTEFLDDGETLELISLALVGEDGRTLYLQRCEAPIDADRREFFGSTHAGPSAWVQQHVLPQLEHRGCLTPCEDPACPWLRERDIADCVMGFIQGDDRPEWLGYYSAYDHVVLCQLFGPMVDLPQGWPMYTKDLRQMLDEHCLQSVTQPDDMPHHALSDARWIMETYKQCVQMLKKA